MRKFKEKEQGPGVGNLPLLKYDQHNSPTSKISRSARSAKFLLGFSNSTQHSPSKSMTNMALVTDFDKFRQRKYFFSDYGEE